MDVVSHKIMRKLILYYLYGIILIPIAIRLGYGRLSNVPIHPGLFLHGIILILLIVYFLRRIKRKLSDRFFTRMIISFTVVYLVNLIAVEMIQFSNISIYKSIEYTSKIFLLLFLSFYIFENNAYFQTKVHKILLINSIVLITNIIIGYYFQIGWQSYKAIEGSYKGLTGGNESSVYSFVAFGYALYTFFNSKAMWKKNISLLILIGSLYSMYIIATKAIMVTGIILVLFIAYIMLGRKNLNRSRTLFTFFLLIVILIGLGIFTFTPMFKERVFVNYLNQVSKGEISYYSLPAMPSILLWLNKIAPVRIFIGISMVTVLFSSHLLNIFFGFGIMGIYEAFGRPPMMHSFSVLGHYGLLGFAVFYLPQLFLAISIIKQRKFEMVNVLFLSVFLYGSLGGFLYGVSGVGSLYALLFALSYYNNSKKVRTFFLHRTR